MKFALLVTAALLSLNTFAAGPVVSQIDADQYDSVNYQGWAKYGDKEVVAAWYYDTADQNSNPAACEVYYKPSAGDDYYLQGWAIRSSPELCITIADNIASNLRNGIGGGTHEDSSAVINEDAIDWTGGEFNPQVYIQLN